MLILDAVEQEEAARREQLAAAEAHIEKLRAELDQLDAIRTAAAALNGSAPDTGAAPRTAPATPSQGTTPSAQERPSVPPADAPSSPPQRPAHGRTASAGARGEAGGSMRDNVLTAIAGGASTVAEIAARCDVPGPPYSSTLRKALQGLVNDGRVVATGATVARRYSTPDAADAAHASPDGHVTRRPLPVLIRSIMQTLENDPGLTEDQLAQALDLHREDVAVATGELLDRGWVTLAPDGGYRQADGSTNDGQGGAPL